MWMQCRPHNAPNEHNETHTCCVCHHLHIVRWCVWVRVVVHVVQHVCEVSERTPFSPSTRCVFTPASHTPHQHRATTTSHHTYQITEPTSTCAADRCLGEMERWCAHAKMLRATHANPRRVKKHKEEIASRVALQPAMVVEGGRGRRTRRRSCALPLLHQQQLCVMMTCHSHCSLSSS
jgi:hypothetical protein